MRFRASVLLFGAGISAVLYSVSFPFLFTIAPIVFALVFTFMPNTIFQRFLTKIALNSVSVGIAERNHGHHDSKVHFVHNPSQRGKYNTICSEIIYVDFGDKTYYLPKMFMHYIDDADEIGFSWVPPQDFLDRLERGVIWGLPIGNINYEYIGFLVNVPKDKPMPGFSETHLPKLKEIQDRLSGNICDTHGTDYNIFKDMLTPVRFTDKPKLSNSIMDKLRKINKAVHTRDRSYVHFNSM